ncbi:MAG TPA: Rrf2 family transcriptional regulator [Candidatus Omnitrophota bacterium]|nr:Rrf2 family transcriptional regulator [Candidatus Omnitrophota bacterium]HQO58932.1 Rrf2 family transcriptional regulator [Candidatus Omnitrophota bacterium]
MFKINKKIEYALISLNYMRGKKEGQLTSAKEISSLFHIPFAPTARVLQIMAQNGILQASQGVHGGYRLKKNLGKVSLGDLNNIIAGPIQIASCSKHTGVCELTSLCTMTSSMNTLNRKLQNLFNTVILEDFFSQKEADRTPIPRS